MTKSLKNVKNEKCTLKGLEKNADGLYKLADLEQRFEETLAAYDAIR